MVLRIDTANTDDVATYESHKSAGIVRPLELPRSWLSLTDQEIEEVTDRVHYFPCRKKSNCKLEHILNWFNMFMDMHNKIISLHR